MKTLSKNLNSVLAQLGPAALNQLGFNPATLGINQNNIGNIQNPFANQTMNNLNINQEQANMMQEFMQTEKSKQLLAAWELELNRYTQNKKNPEMAEMREAFNKQSETMATMLTALINQQKQLDSLMPKQEEPKQEEPKAEKTKKESTQVSTAS